MRKLARETAFKVIYKSFFLDDNLEADEILEEEGISEQQDIDFVSKIIEEYKNNKDSIIQSIGSKSKSFSLDRIYKIDLAILCEAITEILYYKKTPYKIVINEAVEMAKKYSTEKSYAYVNGILKSVVEEGNVV
ncbi:MAG: transcription antitermination factor NusB [Clostridia bacterium]|nr:transcription antitermination factor NusB [Clostridia bacterium]